MESSRSELSDFKGRILNFFREYWLGILIQIAWAVGSCIIAIFYHNLDIFAPNDFAQYYFATQLLFQNPVKIYDPTFLLLEYGVNAFRYFPTVLVLFFAPYSAVPVWDAFIIFSIINVILCLASVFLVLEIIRNARIMVNTRFLKTCVTTFLCFPFFFDFYFYGQISVILGFVLLLSLYFYQTKHDGLGSFFLGISVLVKPVPFFQIIFLLFASLTKDYKLFIKRLIFILLPLLPDVFLFLLVPGLLEGFLHVNLEIFGTRTVAAPTGSFSNFFVSEFGFPSTTVMLVSAASIIVIGLVMLRKISQWEDQILFSFIFGMTGYFLMQVDAWSSQFPYLFPFLIIATIYLIDNTRKRFYTLYLIYPIATELFTVGLILAFTVSELTQIVGSFLLYVVVPVVSFSNLLLNIITIKIIYEKTIRNSE